MQHVVACFITEIDGYAISPAGANHALAFLMPKRNGGRSHGGDFRVEKTKDYNHHVQPSSQGPAAVSESKGPSFDDALSAQRMGLYA